MNKQAPELSPEARRIIHEARSVDDPTAEDQARVKARWLASVAAVAGVSSLTEAARAAGGIGWGLKAAGAALVLAAGAVGLYVALPSDRVGETSRANAPLPAWTGTTHARFEKTPSGQRAARENADAARTAQGLEAPPSERAIPVVSAAPAVVDAEPAAPVTSEPSAAEPGVEQTGATGDIAAAESSAPRVETPGAGAVVARAVVARAARPERVAARAAARPRTGKAPVGGAPPATPIETSSQLGEELALLSDVRSSVRDDAPARALELLARYQARFGRPILGMEADALRVDALCKSGQREAAHASARGFQNDWPGSPLERRVSMACP